jgi:hypothetical protein
LRMLWEFEGLDADNQENAQKQKTWVNDRNLCI